jgi:hypothetical protein
VTGINQYAISQILGSEIAGQMPVGHGYFGALTTKQCYLDHTNAQRLPQVQPILNKDLIIESFLKVREQHDDKLSVDYYIAEKVRNREIMAMSGLTQNDEIRDANLLLLRERKGKKLRGLDSNRYVLNTELFKRIAFACEFTASRLRYETGASIDTLICDPKLSELYFNRVQSVAPGYSWVDYRWALLRIRKAGTYNKDFIPNPLPTFDNAVVLNDAESQKIPMSAGVFSLMEGDRYLYIHDSERLRESFMIHAGDEIRNAITNTYWKPSAAFRFDYIAIENKKIVKPITCELIKRLQPVFNVPRTAAA